MRRRSVVGAAGLATAMYLTLSPVFAQQQSTTFDGVFKSAIELVRVNVTVRDPRGEFVQGLHADDLVVEEDDVPQTIAQFTAGHVPVDLGIALDISASMAGEKLSLAKQSLDSLLYALFDPRDEFLLYGFNNRPVLLQDWTRDRSAVMLAADRISTTGRTSLLDVVADAVPRMPRARDRKTALIVVSDGNDNSSTTSLDEIKTAVRSSETLVYAIGVNCGTRAAVVSPVRRHQALPTPRPFRFPRCLDSVDVPALRQLTDLSGGRTEIVADPRDLRSVTQNIASELTNQYYIGYASTAKKDGRWHSIRVKARNPTFEVRARDGYVAK